MPISYFSPHHPWNQESAFIQIKRQKELEFGRLMQLKGKTRPERFLRYFYLIFFWGGWLDYWNDRAKSHRKFFIGLKFDSWWLNPPTPLTHHESNTESWIWAKKSRAKHVELSINILTKPLSWFQLLPCVNLCQIHWDQIFQSMSLPLFYFTRRNSRDTSFVRYRSQMTNFYEMKSTE